METRAHYLLVGLFVIVLGIGLLGFVIWLIGAQQGGATARYLIFYEGSVTGLREGGSVRLEGVRVGSVNSVRLDLKQLGRVRIEIDILAEIPIKTDTVASLELEGLTGGRYVLLAGGTTAAPPVKKPPDEPYPVIPSRPSSLDELLQDAPDVVANVNRLLVNANRLFSEENVKNFSNTLANVSTLSDTIDDNRDEIDSIIKRIDQALESFDNTAGSVERLASLLEQDGQRLIDKAETTMVKINQLADTLNTTATQFSGDLKRITDQAQRGTASFVKAANQVALIIEENREPILDFTSQGLFEFVSFLTEARELIGNLKTITTDVERNPSGFFFGNSQEGYDPRR